MNKKWPIMIFIADSTTLGHLGVSRSQVGIAALGSYTSEGCCAQ